MSLEAAVEYFNGDELAASVWRGKYALRDKEGNIVEKTPADTHRRLAKEFARIEAKYPNPMSEEEIFGYLADWTIVPQGSPMSAIGNKDQLQSTGNCFVIESPYDSYGGILKTDQEMVQIMKRRGGVGIDDSTLRPRGVNTSNAAGTTDGIGVFMERFSNSTREVAQGGRRGALMQTCHVLHPDIETFITIKQDKTKVTGANVSVRVTDDFMRAVQEDKEVTLQWPVNVPIDQALITKTVRAKDIWSKLVEANWNSAEPGILFWDTILRTSMADLFADKGFTTISTNPCVPGDTPVLTNQGYLPIESLVDETVQVWNGEEWSHVVPYSTGFRETVIVNLSDGSSLRCTHNHEFIIWEGFSQRGSSSKVRAEDLVPGMKLAKFSMPVVEEGEEYSIDAYSQGFYSGDGTTDYDWSSLYSPKYCCQPRLKGIFGEDKGNRKTWKHGSMFSKTFVPTNGSLTYCLNWLAGLLDSDGTLTCDKNGTGYQIGSVNKQFLLNVKLLLTRLGVRAKVVLMHNARKTLMPDGHGGKAWFDCQTVWRLLIGNEDSYQLSKLGLTTLRLQHNGKPPQRDARQFIRVSSIEESEPCETFCFTEPKAHRGTFNGIVTGQCGEITLSAYDSCRLMLLNLTKFVINPFTPKAFFDFVLFNKVAKKAEKLMDDLIDLEIEAVDRILIKIDSDPEPESVKTTEKNLWLRIKEATVKGRRTGLGPTGLGDTLAMLGIKYGTQESVAVTENIYRELALAAHEQSVEMAVSRGPFPVCDPQVYRCAVGSMHPIASRLHQQSSPKSQQDFLEIGRRNIALTTTAPAGSMSIMTQTTSGCEPVFMLSYTRRKKVNPNDTNARVDFIDQSGDAWTEFTVYHHGLKKWMEVTGESDITKSPYYGATANEIDWGKSVELQAAAQKWIEHSISKTCNLPNNATKEQVSDLYFKAWKSGCKGFTIYRDGSRSGVLVSNEKKEQTVTGSAPKRPQILPCDIHRTTIAGVPYIMLVGLLDNKPYEVFCGLSKSLGLPKSKISGFITKNSNKVGVATYDLSIPMGEESLVFENIVEMFDNPNYGAFTRTLSLSLRHGVPVHFVVEQLRKDKYSDMTSFASAAARVFSKHYIADGTKVTGEKKCGECNGTNISYQNGCATCFDCGNSKCG